MRLLMATNYQQRMGQESPPIIMSIPGLLTSLSVKLEPTTSKNFKPILALKTMPFGCSARSVKGGSVPSK